jgi:hypothetical protein
MSFTKFFSRGLQNTLRFLNGTNFSYAGPWIAVQQSTVIDSWFVGDFMSADYTISVDQSTGYKEIIKCLIVASPEKAALTIYGRTNLSGSLVTLSATVDNSRLSLLATPINSASRVIFSAAYYHALAPLQPNQ